MTSKIPDGSNVGKADWSTPIQPLKDVSNGPSPAKPSSNLESVPTPKHTKIDDEVRSLKTRVSNNKGRITESRLAKASELLKISGILTKISKKTPLTPFNPGGGHANDVYITDFATIRKPFIAETPKKAASEDKKGTIKPNPKEPVKFGIKDPRSFDAIEETPKKAASENKKEPIKPTPKTPVEFGIKDPESFDTIEETPKKAASENKKEPIKPNPKKPVKFGIKDPRSFDAESIKPVKQAKKPVSKTAEAIKANINNVDVVFKPGKHAAIRANICYGLTQLFDQLEDVIAVTKKGEASVVSRKDYNVSREIVYNPETDSTYLINEKYMQHQVVVKVTDEYDDRIEGTVDGEDVLLIAVDGHPGFFRIQGLPQKIAKEVDKDYSEEEGEIADASHSESDEANEIYVMHVSPSRIAQWATPDTSWELMTIQDKTYLVPQEKIIEITDKIETDTWLDNDSSIEFDESNSEEDANAVQEIADANESGEASAVSLNGSFDSIRSSDFEIREPVTSESAQVEPDSSEEEAKAFVKIDGKNFRIKIEDNDFKLISDGENTSNTNLEDIARRYELITSNGKDVLVLRSACVPYKGDADHLTYDGKHFDVEDQYDDTFLLSPSYEINVDSDEKAFVKVSQDTLLEDQLIHKKNHTNYVHRNDLDYTILEKDDGLKVVGENISGMVQLKVDKIFQKPKGASKALDLLKASKAREEFFDRIDMPSFIEAFLAVILLRPQDGKVIDLGESNILFQALPNDNGTIDPLDPTCKLRPVIIDLDETMPAANDFTQDPEFVKQGEKTNIHAVRNGLMGFPQVNHRLVGEEKRLAVECIQAIVAKNDEVNEFLLGFLPHDAQIRIKEKMRIAKENKENGKSVAKKISTPSNKSPGEFGEENIKAYNAVVDKLDMFLKENASKDWSLSELFFFTFPEYADQWKQLGAMDPAKKAMHIGADDPNKVRK